MTSPPSQSAQERRPAPPRGFSLSEIGEEDGLLRWTLDAADQQRRASHPPFAAAVVLGDRILGVGVNTVDVDHDPAAHAEVNALRDATARQRRSRLPGAVVYSNARPCSICLAVAAAVGARELVYATPSESVEAERDRQSDMTVRLRVQQSP